MSKSVEYATLPRDIDVLVVGAGHAGLAMSGFLHDAGREHLVIDRRDQLGGGWQDRWDQFRLVTPNWTSSFPGWAYDGADPDGFMSRDEITGTGRPLRRHRRRSGRPRHGDAAADSRRRRRVPRRDQPR